MNIDPKKFIVALNKLGINFVAGVPDNIHSSLCYALDDQKLIDHQTMCHESHAVALASGYNMATKKIAMVYLQNSGLGNIVNPVTSICDKNVYDTPCLFLIGDRDDECQHIKMSSVTRSLLGQLDINHTDLSTNYRSQLSKAVHYIKKNNKSFALIAKKRTFISDEREHYHSRVPPGAKRFDIITDLCNTVPKDTVFVSCTGFTSREMYLWQRDMNSNRYIMNVGGMGLTSAIATGIAKKTNKAKVICLDGDAAILMHAGLLSTSSKQKNLIHILFNNGKHESVGGNKTPSPGFDFKKFAKLSGYKTVMSANGENIKTQIKKALKSSNSVFIEIKTNGISEYNLPRPKIKLDSLKKSL